MENLIVLGVILTILSGITLLANQSENTPALRHKTRIAILAFNFTALAYKAIEVSTAFFDPETQQKVYGLTLEPRNALASFAASVITMAIATLLLMDQVRSYLARFFPQASAVTEEQIPQPPTLHGGQIHQPEYQWPQTNAVASGGFRPESLLHAWAAIAGVHLVGAQISSVLLVGGTSGLAESIGVSYGDLIGYSILLLVVPLLGVGWGTRRTPSEIMARLKLNPPNLKTAIVGVSVAAILLMALYSVATVWMALVSEETFEEQNKATSALTESISTPGLALTVAVTSSVGEEIAFRGALQPIFGLWPTAILFTLAHAQYTFTPATLIILFVALALGYVREHFDTTTAIIVHFLFNLIQIIAVFALRELALA